MRHIKNKAIDEREAAKKAKEKERQANLSKEWFTRSSTNMNMPVGGGAAGSGGSGGGPSNEPAIAEIEVEVEVESTPQLAGGFCTGRTGTGFWKYQPQFKAAYEGNAAQIFVAALIMLNFLANIVEKEVDPQSVHAAGTWRIFEHAFNAIFLLELLINMYARWLKAFWSSGWNIFDFIVVCVGVVSFFRELDGPLKLLRTLRALRVLKLFKRIKSLNKILVMVASAIPGVTSALAVLVISISIFALIAVEFFSTFGTEVTTSLLDDTSLTGANSPWLAAADTNPSAAKSLQNMTYISRPPDCSYVNVRVGIVGSVTSRELCFGAEYFGTFTRAWYTLFQVLTGESWSEAVARPILFGWNDYGPISIYLASFFFILFVLINAFILFNVFVAVLLDKVVAPDEPEEEEDEPPAPEGITLYPWAHNAFAGAPASAPAAADVVPPLSAMTPAAIKAAMGPKPSPAKMMETVVEQLSVVIVEQQKRETEAAELRQLLGTLLERLDNMEAKQGGR